MTTNSNSSQRPNKSIIQNFKNSKPVESSKYKKHDQIWTKITNLNKKPWENKQKMRKEKRGQRSKTSSFFFFLSTSFVFITHNHLHKQTKNYSPTFRCSSSTLFKAEILKNEKIMCTVLTLMKV